MDITIKNVLVKLNEPILSLNVRFKGPALIQVIGPNGAGKTTLLKLILGLIKPVHGKVMINGCDVTGKPEKVNNIIGYVPQLVLDTMYPITPFEMVLNSLLLHKRKWPRIFVKKDEIEKAKEVLEAVDLPKDEWNKRFSELSGGQKQRVLLARAMVYDPEILLLDEPLSAVDPLGKVELASLIGKLAENKLVIVTSHDPILLLPYTDRILLLNRTYYLIGEPEEILKVDVLRNVYGESAVLLDQHVHISDEH